MNSTSILNTVDYNRVIKYELKHPATGEGFGVVFDLISQGSSALKEVTRKQFAEIDLNAKISNEARVSKAEKLTEGRLAACIVGIYVPDELSLIEGIKGTLELSDENKLKIVQTAWVFDQLNTQVNNIQNFIYP